MELKFDKYQGIGNDFIVCELSRPDELSVARAVSLCDRHFGVGADGVLIVSPPGSSAARATMTVINADGSRPEMCGNGLRCVALHLARRAGKEQATFSVDTDAGLRACQVTVQGATALVRTAMGEAQPSGSIEHEVAAETRSFARISMGNPHAVAFMSPISTEELDEVGPALSAKIPGGCNVEIATPLEDGSLRVAVWERGVGRTLACGTGAAATAVAAILADKAGGKRRITVHLPGGPLDITVNAELRVELEGPAQWVYSGRTMLS